MKDEEFRQVTECEGYQVSNLGRVKSLARMVPGKQGPRKHSERILKPFGVGKSREYLGVVLCHDGTKRRCRVHALVANAFLGVCPDGHEVDHRDFNTRNNCVDNLRYMPVGVNRGMRRKEKRSGD